RLARMVGDLQTLAAAEAAALQLALRRCDLAEVAATAADSLAGRFETTGVVLERRLTRPGPFPGPGRPHQLLTTLLSNALKSTPAGGRVALSTRAADGKCVFQVSDTGVGIPADELPHIFDRFWRGQQAAHVSGSGIGLSVAAELARAHGGR